MKKNMETKQVLVEVYQVLLAIDDVHVVVVVLLLTTWWWYCLVVDVLVSDVSSVVIVVLSSLFDTVWVVLFC